MYQCTAADRSYGVASLRNELRAASCGPAAAGGAAGPDGGAARPEACVCGDGAGVDAEARGRLARRHSAQPEVAGRRRRAAHKIAAQGRRLALKEAELSDAVLTAAAATARDELRRGAGPARSAQEAALAMASRHCKAADGGRAGAQRRRA